MMFPILEGMGPEDEDVEEQSRDEKNDSENDHGIALLRSCISEIGPSAPLPVDQVLGVTQSTTVEGWRTTPLGRDVIAHLRE